MIYVYFYFVFFDLSRYILLQVIVSEWEEAERYIQESKQQCSVRYFPFSNSPSPMIIMNHTTKHLNSISSSVHKRRKISKSKGEGRRGEVKKFVAPSPLSPSLSLVKWVPSCLPIHHINVLFILLIFPYHHRNIICQCINNISLVQLVMMLVNRTCELSFPFMKVSLLSLPPLPFLPFLPLSPFFSPSFTCCIMLNIIQMSVNYVVRWGDSSQMYPHSFIHSFIHPFRLHSFRYTGITPHLFSLFFLLSSLSHLCSPLSCSSHSTDPRETAFAAFSLMPSSLHILHSDLNYTLDGLVPKGWMVLYPLILLSFPCLAFPFLSFPYLFVSLTNGSCFSSSLVSSVAPNDYCVCEVIQSDLLTNVSLFLFFSFLFFCFVFFCFVLFCFVLFCFVLFCFVLFCFVLFCFVLFCFVLFCCFSLLLLLIDL